MTRDLFAQRCACGKVGWPWSPDRGTQMCPACKNRLFAGVGRPTGVTLRLLGWRPLNPHTREVG